MDIYLEQFTDDTFPDFFAIYLEENGEESVFDRGLRERIARSAINSERSIVRGIWLQETGTAIGYCEVHNTADPEWEVGIYILERYRFQGVGKTAMRLFFDELAAMGRRSFIAKILPGNLASRSLFEGFGATMEGHGFSGYDISEETLAKEVDALKEGAGADMVARLQVIEDMISEAKQEVCIYRIEWPECG